MQVALSWYPPSPITSATPGGTCVLPVVNILAQEAVHDIGVSLMCVEPIQTLASWTTLPVFAYLDWRYASLNGLPGCGNLAGYILWRGLRLVATKLLLTGLPILFWVRDCRSGLRPSYIIALLLLAGQCLVSVSLGAGRVWEEGRLRQCWQAPWDLSVEGRLLQFM